MEQERTQENTSKIDLQVLLGDVLRAARGLLWLGVLLVVALGAFFGWRAYRSYTPYYQAKASFVVTVSNPLYSGNKVYNSATAEQMAKTFPPILSSGVLRSKIQEKLGISALPSISASVLGNTNIFSITVTSWDPQLSYDVLNAVMECYPEVAEFVVGPTEMTLLNESGVPTQPYNQRNITPGIRNGVIIGLGIWLVILLVVTLSHATVHNEDELKNLTNLRCLGSIPNIGRRSRSQWLRIATEGDRYGFSESVRLLRIRMEKEMAARQYKVLLVSSAIPGEGKTTVSSNLAISLAQKHKRTLIIDLDLRSPSVNQVFSTKSSPGLTDFLQGRAQAREMITTVSVGDLFAVFAGAPAGNAAELLCRRELRELVRQARDAFDYIILDTPPCAMLSDAAEAAGLADCALLTIRQNHSSRNQILEGAQFLAGSNLPIIGCVLNGVRRGLTSGTYGGKYAYGYGYGYGYGRKKNKNTETKHAD